jgi:hypothetical protein
MAKRMARTRLELAKATQAAAQKKAVGKLEMFAKKKLTV